LRKMAKDYSIELVAFLERLVDVQEIKPVVFKEAVKKLDKDRSNQILKRFKC